MELTAKQRKALERHADQLDRRAEQALKQYDMLRAAFPQYAAPSIVMSAARVADDAIDGARAFRQEVDHTERS
jgi:hypothetical protein